MPSLTPPQSLPKKKQLAYRKVPAFSNFNLSSHHYAHSWSKDIPLTPDQITELGIQFVSSSETSKPDILLEIIKAFHPYLLKYTRMVLFGWIYTNDKHKKGKISKDSVAVLKVFLPRGSAPTLANLSKVAKTLHLAFKNQSADEVYNIMASFVMRAVNKYDPYYTDKVREITAAITSKIKPEKQFKPEDLKLSFNPAQQLHWMVKKGFLTMGDTKEPKNNPIFRRPPKETTWPPPAEILDAKPIGLTYHIQRLFFTYLQRHINSVMSEIETKEETIQLGIDSTFADSLLGGHKRSWLTDNHSLPPDKAMNYIQEARWKTEASRQDAHIDIGQIDLHWVETNEDPLFRDLQKEERLLVYLVYTKDLSIPQAAKTLQKTVVSTRRMLDKIHKALQKKVLGAPL
jgi:hypothetical protein